jgi:hypothetical protein
MLMIGLYYEGFGEWTTICTKPTYRLKHIVTRMKPIIKTKEEEEQKATTTEINETSDISMENKENINIPVKNEESLNHNNQMEIDSAPPAILPQLSEEKNIDLSNPTNLPDSSVIAYEEYILLKPSQLESRAVSENNSQQNRKNQSSCVLTFIKLSKSFTNNSAQS